MQLVLYDLSLQDEGKMLLLDGWTVKALFIIILVCCFGDPKMCSLLYGNKILALKLTRQSILAL